MLAETGQKHRIRHKESKSLSKIRLCYCHFAQISPFEAFKNNFSSQVLSFLLPSNVCVNVHVPTVCTFVWDTDKIIVNPIVYLSVH